jgi:hypothetical protein
LKPLLGAERKEHPAKPRSSKILPLIGIFLLWWILTALIYHQTQSNFLRAESGWYLLLSHSTPDIRHGFEKALLIKSYHGHYAPFASLAEFATARLAGTHARFWRWRQITVLGVLATTLFLCARNSGCALQLSRLKANLCAVGVTAILIFQVQMRDFIAWPFMIMQLFWLLCTVMALLSLVQTVRRPAEVLWPWLAAGAAYGSLHFLGLGLATVAATAAVLAGIWLETRHRASSEASKIPVPLLSMIALTSFHALFMLQFDQAEAIVVSPGWQPASFLMASLAFIPSLVLATLRGLFGTGQLTLSAEHSSQDWPYGLAILLSFGFLVTSSFSRSWREPTTRNRARFILQTFASVSFLMMIALIAVREWREPAPHGFADYLMGARHLIPSAFALAGVLSELLFLGASAPILLSAMLNVGLAVCAITGNLQHAANVYPKLSPKSMISHAVAWKSIVAMARECRSANLAIPNVPIGALTQEFGDWDLKLFEPLLRADLQVPPSTSLQFVAWNELTNEYYRDVPSLVKVERTLKLEAKK